MMIENFIVNLEKSFPLSTQEKWDNSGWQIKVPAKNDSILTALSISDDIIDEAIDKNVSLILTHHPLFFKSVSHINYSKTPGKFLYKLIKNDIS